MSTRAAGGTEGSDSALLTLACANSSARPAIPRDQPQPSRVAALGGFVSPTLRACDLAEQSNPRSRPGLPLDPPRGFPPPQCHLARMRRVLAAPTPHTHTPRGRPYPRALPRSLGPAGPSPSPRGPHRFQWLTRLRRPRAERSTYRIARHLSASLGAEQPLSSFSHRLRLPGAPRFPASSAS